MSRSRRYVSVLLSLVTLLALGFVVGIASRSRPGRTGDDPLLDFDARLDVDLGAILGWAIFVMAILGAILLVFGIREAKPRRDGRRRNWLGILLGVLVFLIIFRFIQPIAGDLLGASEVGDTPEAVGDGLDGGGGGPVGWIFSLLVAAVMAAALTRVGMSVREAAFDQPDPVTRSSAPGPAIATPPRPLPLDQDPRSRVLNAYDRFETAAAAAGVSRRRNETAGRHSRRVTGELAVGARSVEVLMGHFSNTRFGFSAVSPEQAEEAETVSAELVEEMGH